MAALNTYIVGTLIEVDATFTDEFGTPLDPTSVTAEMLRPDSVREVLTNTITRTGVGTYKITYTPTLSGRYAYRFAGIGALIAANEGAFLAQTEFPGG